jgi:hypothetical protein
MIHLDGIDPKVCQITLDRSAEERRDLGEREQPRRLGSAASSATPTKSVAMRF